MTRFVVVIERAGENYSAYVPDLPGCVATGASVSEIEERIGEAVRSHVDGMKEDGLPVPTPTAVTHYVEA